MMHGFAYSPSEDVLTSITAMRSIVTAQVTLTLEHARRRLDHVVAVGVEIAAVFLRSFLRSIYVAGRALPAATVSFDWVNDMYVCVANEREVEGIDLLFAKIDDLLSDDRIDECNDLLRTIDLHRLNIELMVGLMSATTPARDELPYRSVMLTRIRRYISETAPERAPRLLPYLR